MPSKSSLLVFTGFTGLKNLALFTGFLGIEWSFCQMFYGSMTIEVVLLICINITHSYQGINPIILTVGGTWAYP